MQKSVPLFLLSLFFISFVSAQFFGGYGSSYGGYGFSLSDLFSRIDPQEMILVSLFIILFLFIASALKKIGIFRDAYGNPQMGVIVIISLVVSLIATYGIYRSDYDLGGLFQNFGVSGDSLYTVLLIVLLVAAIFIIWKFGFGTLLMILGLLLGLVTLFTEIIYEKTTAFIIAGVLFLVGLLLLRATRGRFAAGGRWAGRKIAGGYDWKKEKSQWKGRTHVLILGVLVAIFGLVKNLVGVIIAGSVLVLIGLWLWARKRPGSYRPIAGDWKFKHYPIQEKRQLRSGTPLFFLGALIVIFGLLINQKIVIIIGVIIGVIGLLTRIFR